jgi:hypothetical protein
MEGFLSRNPMTELKPKCLVVGGGAVTRRIHATEFFATTGPAFWGALSLLKL